MNTVEKTRKIISPFIPRSHLTTRSNKTGSWRFLRPRYDEKTAPCSAACPAGEDIARIEMLTTQGQFKEAWETILQENPFPAVCGRVCFHPCESVCNRAEYDDAIAIHTVERFLADTAARYELKPSLPVRPLREERIAVVGAGPAGLAAAWFLTRLGYRVDVFEAMPEPGGVLRWGIPRYRLPEAPLQKEIQTILTDRVNLVCNRGLGQDFLEEARGRYRAVFLGCGHSGERALRIPGEDLEGVEEGLPLLQALRRGEAPRFEGPAAVIGGGNTAIDVARCLVRLGAEPILVYRRRRADMPAFAHEVAMAEEEGVEIRELWTPIAIERQDDGFRVTIQRMAVASEDDGGRARVVPEPGVTEELFVRRVFKAIGNSAAEAWYDPPEASTGGWLHLPNSRLRNEPGLPVVVYGGDLAAETKSVVHAVASAKEAAIALDVIFNEGMEAVREHLRACRVGIGPSLSMEIYLGGERCRRNSHVVQFDEINTDYFHFETRIVQPRLLREERISGFAEIDLKVSANVAMREAERCFNCGICNQCDNCRLFCPEIAVFCGDSGPGRQIDYDYCKGCGVCVVECPRNAMALSEEKEAVDTDRQTDATE